MGEAARKMESNGAALAKREGGAITGTFHSPAAIDARLKAAGERFHLCSPFTAVGVMPEGCGVQLALVKVDVDHETYDVGFGKLGLAKSALDRISHGIGISWDPMLSRRLDDGRDPHYAHYRAVGRYRASDGQQQIVIGEKEMDLRDGSPQCEALEERARKKNKSADAQIREMRMHILGHAETKARLRAIRSMGVRTSYDRDELEKPFACARVVFTGKTEDAELRREFSKMTAASFLGGVTTLYGEQPGHQRTLPAGETHAPPPVGAARDEDDFDGDEGDYVDTDASCAAAEPDASRKTQPQRSQSSSGGVIRLGKSKGTPIRDADDGALKWYADVLRENIADPKRARFKSENERDLAAVEAEQARRRGEDEPAEQGGESDWPDDEDFS